MKKSCMWQAHDQEQRKMTHSMGGNKMEIDFLLVGKDNRKYLRHENSSLGSVPSKILVSA